MSIHLSVGLLVGPSVGQLVRNGFAKIKKSVGKLSFSDAYVAIVYGGMSVHQLFHPSIPLSIHLSVNWSVNWSVHPSVRNYVIKFANFIAKSIKINQKSVVKSNGNI